MRHLLFQNALTKQGLIVALQAAGEVIGPAIAREGYQDVEVVCQATNGTNGTSTFRVTECATTGGTYTDVTGATGVISEANNTKPLIIRVNCENRKAFFKVACVVATATATGLSAAVHLENPTIPQPITQDLTPINA
jgi:hypothetical protein